MEKPEEIAYDSKEEVYFTWYLEELKAHGFIKKYQYQPKPFDITEPVHAIQIIRRVKKTRTKTVMLLRQHSYQADFLVIWEPKAKNIFFHTIDEITSGSYMRYDDLPFIANINKEEAFSVIDVKGNFSQNDAYRRFSTDQKLVFMKAKIYVQKIIPYPSIDKHGKIKTPSAIFLKTFVPTRYLLTDKTRKKRVINYPHRTIQQYVSLYNEKLCGQKEELIM